MSNESSLRLYVSRLWAQILEEVKSSIDELSILGFNRILILILDTFSDQSEVGYKCYIHVDPSDAM